MSAIAIGKPIRHDFQKTDNRPERDRPLMSPPQLSASLNATTSPAARAMHAPRAARARTKPLRSSACERRQYAKHNTNTPKRKKKFSFEPMAMKVPRPIRLSGQSSLSEELRYQ